MNKDKRVRNWSFILYPDSAPEDWKTILEELHIPCLISPLHDKDLDIDGDEKKAHRHVILIYSGKQSYESVCEDIAVFNGTIPKRVRDITGYARYLCHLDQTGKTHYDPKDVIELSGASYEGYLVTETMTTKQIREIKQFINDKDIRSFCTLSYYASNYHQEWEKAIDNNHSFWRDYLNSKNYKIRNDVVEKLEREMEFIV